MQRLPLEALAQSQKARSGIAKKLTIFLALAVVFVMLTIYFFFVRLHEVLVFWGRVHFCGEGAQMTRFHDSRCTLPVPSQG
jgi:hypothetical protein